MAAVRFMLKTLTLSGRKIRFSEAWLDWQGQGLTGIWSGCVQGADGSALMEIRELKLVAETVDGHWLAGHAFVPLAKPAGDEFQLRGTNSLRLDGRDLVT